jgi:hypothetical protein
MSNESPDREALARMVRDLQFRLRQEERAALDLIGQRDRFESEIEDIYRALGGEGEWTAKLPSQPPPDSGDLAADALELAHCLVAQLAAARAEVERLKADMAFCGIGYNEDDELALSMKPYNAFVRSKANETVAAESEQLKARVDHLTQELMREQDKAFALRAALAQVGERIKNEVEAKLTQIESEIKERRYSETHQAALGAIRRAFLLVSQIDIAAIVAASADTRTLPEPSIVDELDRQLLIEPDLIDGEAAAEGREAADGKQLLKL